MDKAELHGAAHAAGHGRRVLRCRLWRDANGQPGRRPDELPSRQGQNGSRRRLGKPSNIYIISLTYQVSVRGPINGVHLKGIAPSSLRTAVQGARATADMLLVGASSLTLC